MTLQAYNAIVFAYKDLHRPSEILHIKKPFTKYDKNTNRKSLVNAIHPNM